MSRVLASYAVAILVVSLASLGVLRTADARQTGSPPRIGVLLGGLPPESKEAQAFRKGLEEAGYSREVTW